MALGLTLGIVLALSGGNGTKIDQSSLGASPKPPQGTGSAATAQPLASPDAASPTRPSCGIIVPADPLSARGLSTPYQLTGPSRTSAAAAGCTLSASVARAGLVRATILDPATGAVAVYTPAVVTKGAAPAAAPVAPDLPPGAVVTIDFGSAAMDLTPVGATAGALAQGHCASGPSPASGTVSSCNGAAFFTAALPLLRTGRLRVPSAGTSANMVATGGGIGTGRDCPNVRNFEVAGPDQDVSVLVDGFLDPAFGCQPFTAPDLARGNVPATSLALDELLAARHQPKAAALVPANELARDASGRLDPARTNAYRAELGQPPISARNDRYDSPAAYCQNMVNIQSPFLAANQDVLAAAPAPAASSTLLTYLASRLSTAFGRLGCRQFGLTDPVTLVRDPAGAVTSASFDTTPQTPQAPQTPPQATASGGR
jgi:hypothetical protein